MLRLTANYRRFRALRRQLRELQGEIDRRLDRYEQDVTVRARRALKFLPPPPKMGSNGAERGRKQAAGRNAKA